MKKQSTIKDWEKFRDEIFQLVILHIQIMEYFKFDKKEYIPMFFELSKNNAISSFFIQCGLIMRDGKPCIKNFLNNDEYSSLNDLFSNNILTIRNKYYAHYDKDNSYLKDALSNLTNTEIDIFYNKIIDISKKLDIKYGLTNTEYEYVAGCRGISVLDSIIDSDLILKNIKLNVLKNKNKKITIYIEIQSGKLYYLDLHKNKNYF
jgi:hypothetical protein